MNKILAYHMQYRTQKSTFTKAKKPSKKNKKQTKSTK